MRVAWVLVGVVAMTMTAAAAGPAPQATTHVHIQGFAFDPASADIDLGDTITWDNHDAVPHTSTSDAGVWNSGTMVNGGPTYARAFNAAGAFAYHCNIHNGMKGTIRVSDPHALPDLVVAALAMPGDPPDTVPGVQQRIDVIVRNDGLNRAQATHVAVSYVYQGQRHLIDTVAVGILPPGATAGATVSWSTVGKVGDFVIVASADSAGEAPETNEANNDATAVATVLVAGVQGIDVTDPL